MESGVFEYSFSIRGWCLGMAKGNALRGLQSAGGEELRPLFGRTLMPSVLDRARVVTSKPKISRNMQRNES